jgi:hypothetical protein
MPGAEALICLLLIGTAEAVPFPFLVAQLAWLQNSQRLKPANFFSDFYGMPEGISLLSSNSKSLASQKLMKFVNHACLICLLRA